MPVPSAISDLSQTAASNFPAGSENPNTADDYMRAHASFLATLRDGKGFTTEASVASAATCDIGAANSLYVAITGTTMITSFGANYNGPRFIRFAGSLTLTHNASSLILPGGANIVTQAGDTAIVVPQSAGWRVVSYERASGTSLIGALASGTAVTASGTSVDFTSIPSWAKRITISVSGLSTAGATVPAFQIGDAGGIEATGYSGAATTLTTASNSVVNISSGFSLNLGNAGYAIHGALVLTLLDAATNTWAASGNFSVAGTAVSAFVSGTKALSEALDRVRVSSGGTFDAGAVNILFE